MILYYLLLKRVVARRSKQVESQIRYQKRMYEGMNVAKTKVMVLGKNDLIQTQAEGVLRGPRRYPCGTPTLTTYDGGREFWATLR